MILISLFTLFSQTLSANPSLSCESNRSLILNDGGLPNAETYRLVSTGQGEVFRHNLPGGSLIYNASTGQYFYEDSTGRRDLIRRDPRGQLAILENAESRVPAYRPISTPLRSLIGLMDGLGAESLRNQLQECGSRQTFREQLRNPMADVEVDKCRHDLNLLNRISRCFDQNNCPEVFNDLANARTSSPPYSFAQVFQEGPTMTDPNARLTTLFVADSVASAAVTNSLLWNRARIGALASRVGMRFLGVFSLAQAMLATTKPIIVGLLYDDQCGAQSLSESTGRSSEDCVGRSANSLINQFGRDIEQAISNQEQFLQQIDQASNGLNGRLACYAIESQMNQWRQRLGEFQPYTCQGRMIVTGNGHNYIVGENNTIYRHENRDRTFHFRLNAPMQIENRNTGVRTTPIPVNEIPSGRITADQVIPMRIVHEETIMAAMLPRYLQEFEGGVCRQTPAEESPSPNTVTQ